MRPERLLEQLGFSQNEVKIYLAALETGLASAQEIAKKANLQRTTTYSVLGYLADRGVVAKSKIRGKTRYVAEPPIKLLSLVSDLQAKIKASLPELEAIYNKSEKKPRIVFYEGDQAIQTVYDDTLREKPGEILEWNTNAYFERFPQHDYIRKRIALGVRAKRIAGSGSIWHTKHKKTDVAELAETVIVPRDLFWPDIEVNIYNDKVAFMNYAENLSVIVTSKAIAEAMRQAYQLSWLGAKSIEIKS